jgi:hypothetical protein
MNETWFKDNWRPLAAYTYIFICICDFIIFPVGNMLVCYYLHTPYVVWVPLTLQGGAFLHLSFGAILGAGAYTQGLSQIEMIKNMPDYSQMNYGSQYNAYGQPPYNSDMNPPISSPMPPLNPPINPATVLQAPRRGIPKG